MISEQTKNWLSLGVGLIGMVIGAISLYFAAIEKVSDFDIYVRSNTRVVEVMDGVMDLDIYYKGDSLIKEHNMASILVVEFLNSGSAPITLADFDPKFPIGFEIINGYMATPPRIVEASSDYLRSSKMKAQENSKVEMPNRIFEINDFVRIQTTVIHKESEEIRIESFGKIVGVNSIDVINSYRDIVEHSFIQRVFQGGFYVNAMRLLISAFVLGAIAAGIGMLVDMYGSNKTRQRRQSVANGFRASVAKDVHSSVRHNISEYVSEGFYGYRNSLRRAVDPREREAHIKFIAHLMKAGTIFNLSLKVLNKTGDHEYFVEHYSSPGSVSPLKPTMIFEFLNSTDKKLEITRDWFVDDLNIL